MPKNSTRAYPDIGVRDGATVHGRPAEFFGLHPDADSASNQARMQEALNAGGLVTLLTPGDYPIDSDTFTVPAGTQVCIGPGVNFTIGGTPTTITTLDAQGAGPTNFRTLRILPMSLGVLQIGTKTQTAAGETVNFTNLRTNSAAYVRPVDMYFESGINPGSSGAGAADFHLGDCKLYGGGSNTNITASTRMYCWENQVQYTGAAGRTLGQGVAVYNNVRHTGAGTATELVADQNIVQNTSTGVVTTGIGVQVKSFVNSGGGSIGTAIGLNVENQTAGTVNYALKTGTGRVSFGDQVEFATKTPASAAAAGNAGTITWDTGFLYVCTAANTWKRAAIVTW